MECLNCGENIGEDGKFCPDCGTKVEQEVAPEVVSVEVPVQTESYQTSKYSVQEFLDKTAEKNVGEEVFELENDYLLDINLNGKVWAKLGAMVAYTGDVRFKKQSSLEGGIDKFLMKKISGENSKLNVRKRTGTRVYG